MSLRIRVVVSLLACLVGSVAALAATASAQSLEVEPAVLRVLTSHPAFQAFPLPRIIYLAATTESERAGIRSRTKSKATISVLPNGLAERRWEFQYLGESDKSTSRTDTKGLAIGTLWVSLVNESRGTRSYRYLQKKEEQYESVGTGRTIAIRNVEGGLFPLRAGARLSFEYDRSSTSQERKIGEPEGKPYEFKWTYAVTVEIRRQVEARTVVPGMPGMAWEGISTSRRIDAGAKSESPGPGKFAFLEDAAAFVGTGSEGSYPSRTVIDEIHWRDASGTERRLSRGGVPGPVAATVREPSREERERARQLLGQAFKLFQAGDFEAAAIRFKQGLELTPTDGLAHYYLAETYVRLDQRFQAWDHYEATIRLVPDSVEAVKAQVALDKLRRGQSTAE